MSIRWMIPFLLLSAFNAFSQQKTTLTYKDSLQMDIYSDDKLSVKQPCVVFVFGGGFFMGQRDAGFYIKYFNTLAEHHYKVISIDYRLGLKNNKKKLSPLHIQPLKDAIDMAVTDVYDATAYLIKNADQLGIDTSMILLSGSSAGAITVLHADWEKRNHTDITSSLPADFQYKGVISFAGAILSFKGKPAYKLPPAPTMLFHGTDDHIVTYNKIRLFNKGFFGSKSLAKKFKQKKYPYYFERVEGMGHEVAGSPMTENLDNILWFIDAYVFKKKQYLMEVDFNDLQRKRTFNINSFNK